MCIVFVGGVHEHETCGALRMIGSEHADVETRDGFPDEHDWSADSATDKEFGQSFAMRRAVRGDGPGRCNPYLPGRRSRHA